MTSSGRPSLPPSLPLPTSHTVNALHPTHRFRIVQRLLSPRYWLVVHVPVVRLLWTPGVPLFTQPVVLSASAPCRRRVWRSDPDNILKRRAELISSLFLFGVLSTRTRRRPDTELQTPMVRRGGNTERMEGVPRGRETRRWGPRALPGSVGEGGRASRTTRREVGPFDASRPSQGSPGLRACATSSSGAGGLSAGEARLEVPPSPSWPMEAVARAGVPGAAGAGGASCRPYPAARRPVCMQSRPGRSTVAGRGVDGRSGRWESDPSGAPQEATGAKGPPVGLGTYTTNRADRG